MMIFALGLYLAVVGLHPVELPPGVRFLPGPVNGLLVNGRVLVYGDSGGRVKEVSHVLFTHARRDMVWAGTALVRDGAAAVVPERERSLFENPASFWESYWRGRFHDYSQVNTKVLRDPVRVSRAVRGGEVLDLDGVRVEVIDTPGYTAGAVSYWIESGGKRIACTGDSSMVTDSCSMFRVCRTQFLNQRRAGITAMPHEQGI
jgi:glyoxylase-like metal-dependent hydrolase (beta-lactamase superfamily II)